MSNPLSDLQQILTGRASVAGRVVSLANSMARVATANGLVETAHDGTFGVGDRVTMLDGKAVRVQSAVDVPVFLV